MNGLRILLLNYEFPPLGGGAAPVTEHLSKALAGHTFDLVTMGFPGLPAEERVGTIHVHRVPCKRKRKELSTTLEMLSFLRPAWKKANELIAKNNYDLIHCHFILPTGVLAWRLSRKHGIPYIISTHGSDIPGYNPDRFQLLHKLLLPFWRAIVRKARLILTPSENLRRLVLKSWNAPEHIKAIHWGIDIPPAPKGKKENRILFAGRLFERKGAGTLVDAALKMNLKGWEVAIVGDGPQRAELERKAKNNSAIKFYGWMPREKLQKFYEKSKIFAFVSTAESFGLVLAEAMAAEMAVVTSNESACPEVVGDAGITIPAKDPQALKAALESLMRSPKQIEALGNAGRKRVLDQFTWEQCAKEYDKVYRSVAKTG
ncbi:MAG TPA: glycosyltransferase family 4 protein [Candidatus Binatia bacterium]|nr:glycosyltransferase family 4 protein [Candidatus Binatia bacterium]